MIFADLLFCDCSSCDYICRVTTMVDNTDLVINHLRVAILKVAVKVFTLIQLERISSCVQTFCGVGWFTWEES